LIEIFKSKSLPEKSGIIVDFEFDQIILLVQSAEQHKVGKLKASNDKKNINDAKEY
jgi:hypothetical protein